MSLGLRFAIYSSAGTIALMPLLVLPAMVGVLVDESPLSEAQAGWSASIGFLGSALIALLMALRMHHLNLRQVAMYAFAFGAAGDAASGFLAHHAAVFMALRFVTGICLGAAYTALVAAFARERHHDRGYGMFITLQFIVSGIGLYLLPVYSSWMSVTGVFGAFAALDLCGLFLCRWLPDDIPVRSARLPPGSEMRVLLARAALFGALGFTIFEVANTAQFTYVERYGVILDLSDHQLGLAMLIGSLAGIPGAFTIILTGDRFGWIGPLAFGVAVGVAGLAVLIGAGRFPAFLFGFVLLGFSWAFCLPYIQALLASLDPNGSAVAAGSFSSTIGGAVGPGMAALILGDRGYHGVFLFAIVFLLLSLTSFFIASRSPKPVVLEVK